jgi:hypothetical protein
MPLKLLFAAMPAALLVLGNAGANAQTINEAGALACVNDKWDVKEPEKGHKLVDALVFRTIQPNRSTQWNA